jgi:hypothetical protein
VAILKNEQNEFLPRFGVLTAVQIIENPVYRKWAKLVLSTGLI